MQLNLYKRWKSRIEHTQLCLVEIHLLIALTRCEVHPLELILEWELLRSPQAWQPSEMHLSTPLLSVLPGTERTGESSRHEACNSFNSVTVIYVSFLPPFLPPPFLPSSSFLPSFFFSFLFFSAQLLSTFYVPCMMLSMGLKETDSFLNFWIKSLNFL